MLNANCPEDLRKSFARYGEIEEELRSLFWPMARRALLVAPLLALVFSFWIRPWIGLPPYYDFLFIMFAVPGLAAYDVNRRKKTLKKEQNRIAVNFARRGLKIAYAPSLGVRVNKGKREELLKLIINT